MSSYCSGVAAEVAQEVRHLLGLVDDLDDLHEGAQQAHALHRHHRRKQVAQGRAALEEGSVEVLCDSIG
jgi:hypothetical protein